MKALTKTVADYNATYGTHFSVINPVSSLRPNPGEQMLATLDSYLGIGGLYLFYDSNKDLLAVYSAKDISIRLNKIIKKDAAGNWVVDGNWVSDPTYVAFVIGSQDKLYEKDSLKSYLIEELNPRYDENGNLTH